MEKKMSSIVSLIVPVFLQHGYEGATLSLISKATGLGRASLYHHFPGGKEQMAEVVLDYLNEGFTATVLNTLKSENEPIESLKAMSEGLNQFYNHGQNICIISAFSFGEGHSLFADQIQQALNMWLDLLSKVLVKSGLGEELALQRAQDAIIQIQGALVLTRVLGHTEPFERILKTLPEQLLSPADYSK